MFCGEYKEFIHELESFEFSEPAQLPVIVIAKEHYEPLAYRDSFDDFREGYISLTELLQPVKQSERTGFLF